MPKCKALTGSAVKGLSVVPVGDGDSDGQVLSVINNLQRSPWATDNTRRGGTKTPNTAKNRKRLG